MIKIRQIYFIFTTVQYNIIIRQSLKHFFQPAYHCVFNFWNDYKPQNEKSNNKKMGMYQLGTQSKVTEVDGEYNVWMIQTENHYFHNKILSLYIIVAMKYIKVMILSQKINRSLNRFSSNFSLCFPKKSFFNWETNYISGLMIFCF